MRRFCGAARAAPLAARAFPLRAVTGRALSTMPAKPVRLDPQLESVLARFKKGGSNEKEGAARLVEDFERLQSRKVMRVLLVCSDYDSYTFEEDGLLTELIDAEYSDNHLSKPPTIERVPTPEKAITRVRENPSGFDLIITLLRNEGHNTNAASFVSSIQQEPLPSPRPSPRPSAAPSPGHAPAHHYCSCRTPPTPTPNPQPPTPNPHSHSHALTPSLSSAAEQRSARLAARSQRVGAHHDGPAHRPQPAPQRQQAVASAPEP